MAAEIDRLLDTRVLTRAVQNYAKRAAAEGGVFERVGAESPAPAPRKGLVEEAQSSRSRLPSCLAPRPAYRTSWSGPARAASAKEPSVSIPLALAKILPGGHAAISVRLMDRLLATAIHEIGHNLGLPESEDMNRITYLVQNTAEMGWADSNVSPNLYGQPHRQPLAYGFQRKATLLCRA